MGVVHSNDSVHITKRPIFEWRRRFRFRARLVCGHRNAESNDSAEGRSTLSNALTKLFSKSETNWYQVQNTQYANLQ